MSRFVILMYHMISEPITAAEVKYACPPRQFEKHIQMLLNNGFTPVSIESVENYYSQNTALPENSFLITLDDGFEDNYLNAFPVFKRYNIPALIYLATGSLGKTNQWMSQPTFTERKMLSWKQIKELASQGIDFGSHTVSHPRLTEFDDDRVGKEQANQNKLLNNS